MSAPSNPNDDGLFQTLPGDSGLPAGIDRREFIGAAAVMTGAALTSEALAAEAAKEEQPKQEKIVLTGKARAKGKAAGEALVTRQRFSWAYNYVGNEDGKVLSGERFMKTSLVLIVAATLVFVFTQAADAQSVYQPTVSYYAPVPTTVYYAPTTAYYAPTTAYYAPTTAYYAPTTAYYAPTVAYYPSSAYYAPTTAYYGSGYRGGLFGTGLFGWAGLRGIDRRWDRRMAPTPTPY